jgi:quercetin dioxygenase-like cupin family protein
MDFSGMMTQDFLANGSLSLSRFFQRELCGDFIALAFCIRTEFFWHAHKNLIDAGEGITLWALGVLVTLKALGNETGGSYALFEEVVFPGQEGLPGHVHTLEDETWYMLEGELVWTLGGQDFLGKKGSFIHLPRFVPHSCANKSNKPARMVITYAPAGFEQWYLDVGRPAVADHRNSPPDVSSEELSGAVRRGKEYGIIFIGHEDEDSEMMASGSNQTPYQ